jgi:hypothetical protein
MSIESIWRSQGETLKRRTMVKGRKCVREHLSLAGERDGVKRIGSPSPFNSNCQFAE